MESCFLMGVCIETGADVPSHSSPANQHGAFYSPHICIAMCSAEVVESGRQSADPCTKDASM